MCNHIYSANQKFWPSDIGKVCPYPRFYADVVGRTATAQDEPPPADLALDSDGACLFHSSQAEWKRKNGFREKFLDLVRLLDAHGAARYDFAEFVFVGDEVTTPKGSRENLLRITDFSFDKQAMLFGARFMDAVELERVYFKGGAEFRGATFAERLTITDTRIHGAGLDGVEFAAARFIRVDFSDYAIFSKSRFTGPVGGGNAVHFQDSRFGALTDFSSAVFDLTDESTVCFERVRFEDFTNFSETRFSCHVVFSDVVFLNVADFIDTRFGLVRSMARYAGAAAEFNAISVTNKGVVTFLSSDPERKLFDHDVELTFKEDPEGLVRFKNVNFAHFAPHSKARLMELAKTGSVEIGSGCIKYRLQTAIMTVPVGPENSPLVVELCQTFTSYFTRSHGLNLGFEIVARDCEKVSFFYFSDEDVPYTVFLERLAQTEASLWNLLSIGSDAQLLALAARGQTADVRGESLLINAIDGLTALFGTFFRVSARIGLGRWREADTVALLGAIRFNDDGADLRATSLHRTLVNRYTGTTLLEFNRKQHADLSPISAKGQARLASGKIRILFLGANSSVAHLDLEREVSRIDTQLKLARERRVELKHLGAVTMDTLIQAMFDEQPEIVHFSGHGTEAGIMLRDEVGAPRTVSGEALAALFENFPETLQCVVLNSCYSEVQARAIKRHVPFVVGLRSAISDEAAIAFSIGFYTAVAAGEDIPSAFKIGKARVHMAGADGVDLLTLL